MGGGQRIGDTPSNTSVRLPGRRAGKRLGESAHAQTLDAADVDSTKVHEKRMPLRSQEKA